MIKAILAICLALAIAAVFVLLAKWQEERELRRAEEQKKADEISRALSLEKDIEMLIDGGKKDLETIQWYADELMKTKACFEQCRNGNMVLQDKLSAILCPRNDHVWVDGICTKCGRQKDERAD